MWRRKISMIVYLGLVLGLAPLTCLSPRPLHSQEQAGVVLTNDDVLKMVQAGLPESVVVAKIKASKCAFDTSPDALIKLKSAGATAGVLLAVTEAAGSGGTRKRATEAQSNLSGFWNGTLTRAGRHYRAKLVLSQTGTNLVGNLTIYNFPDLGVLQINITSGLVVGDRVSLSGQSKLAGGTIQMDFTGSLNASVIEGTMDTTISSIMGTGTERYTLRFSSTGTLPNAVTVPGSQRQSRISPGSVPSETLKQMQQTIHSRTPSDGSIRDVLKQMEQATQSSASGPGTPRPSRASASSPAATIINSNPTPCTKAVSLGYSIKVGRHLYAVKKLTTSAGQIHVFFDEKGTQVTEDKVLLSKLASGAWARENIVESPSTRAEIAMKPRTLTALIGTSQDFQTYTMLQDALVRGMTEAIEAWVTGGATLSTVVPHLTRSTIQSRLLSSPQTVLKMTAQVGLVESVKYYKGLSKILPPADSTILGIGDLLNVKVQYSLAHGLDLPNEALAAALGPKNAGQLIQQAIGSAISEILPSAGVSNQVVTLENLLDLDKSLAKTLPGLENYNLNVNLVLNEAAANDRLIKQWANQAALACTAAVGAPSAVSTSGKN